MPKTPSAAYRFAAEILKRDTGEWLDEQFQKGTSWRGVAIELALATKGKCRYNEATLATWHRDYLADQARQPDQTAS